jgi:hypothetical protein
MYLTLWSWLLLEKPPVAQLLRKISQQFMESEGSLPFSQEPATGPYPEPDETSPHTILHL